MGQDEPGAGGDDGGDTALDAYAHAALRMDRPERTFIRILSPPKEAGIGSLRIKAEM
jgi:hypothetical protein